MAGTGVVLVCAYVAYKRYCHDDKATILKPL